MCIRDRTKAPLKKTVSGADFYSYRIMLRDGEECYLLLFHNHSINFWLICVDRYAKIKTERLNWILDNQKKLRSKEYVHLKDAMTRTDGQFQSLTRWLCCRPLLLEDPATCMSELKML